MPVIDDHAWHVIIRRYAVCDQFQDVFTTLCNYAGVDAFFSYLRSSDSRRRVPLSFVKLNNGWSVFDAYNGGYFKNKNGGMADIEELSNGNWQVYGVSGAGWSAYYRDLFSSLKPGDYKDWKLSRAAVQSPLRRFILWLRNALNFSNSTER